MKYFLVCIVVASAFVETIAFRIRPSFNGRIIGGDETKIEDFPYQLSFQIYEIHLCGASLLSSKKAVTAAHCTDNFPVDTFTVRAGSSVVDSGGKLVSVSCLDQHPKFNPDYTDYDVSVLTLSEQLLSGPSINYISLQPVDEEPTFGSKAIATGWGEVDENGTYPVNLQLVELEYSSFNCTYRSSSSQNGCFVAEPESGVCWGDSGGPIVIDAKLVGIVSWGDTCTFLNDTTLIHTSIWDPEINSFINDNVI